MAFIFSHPDCSGAFDSLIGNVGDALTTAANAPEKDPTHFFLRPVVSNARLDALENAERDLVVTTAFQVIALTFTQLLRGSASSLGRHGAEGGDSESRAALSLWLSLLEPALALEGNELAGRLQMELQALEAGEAVGAFKPQPRMTKHSFELTQIKYRIDLMREYLRARGWNGQRINSIMRRNNLGVGAANKWRLSYGEALSPAMKAKIERDHESELPPLWDSKFRDWPNSDDREHERAAFEYRLESHFDHICASYAPASKK